MQNAKDTFYVALRNRLAILNPARQVEIRGVQRPAILVEEAEAPMKELPNDTFVLRWTAATALEDLPVRLMQLVCEVHYATSGSQPNAGLDRGRAMTEMDRELLDILTPMCAPKMSYTTTPATALATNVFWSEPQLAALETVRDQLLRVASIQVLAFDEPGEA